jgi:ATP-dependent helicase HrpA
MNVHVVEDDGGVTSSGRDLNELQRELAAEASACFAELDHTDWNRDGITSWDFGDLPEQVQFESGGLTLIGHPILVDQGEDVSLRLTDSAEKAAQHTRAGQRRLFCLAERNELRSQVAWLPRLDQMKLYAATLCGAKQLERQLAELIADRAFLDQDHLACDADQFNRLLLRGRDRIALAVQDVAQLAQALLEAYHQTKVAIEEATSPRWQHAIEDIRAQIEHLTPEGFLADTPWTQLRHYTRYFQAARIRLEKLAGAGVERDRQHYDQIAPFWQAYLQRAADHHERGIYDKELVHFRWMLEEFRVSLFAQHLGTSMSVSAKRLEKQWANVQS